MARRRRSGPRSWTRSRRNCARRRQPSACASHRAARVRPTRRLPPPRVVKSGSATPISATRARWASPNGGPARGSLKRSSCTRTSKKPSTRRSRSCAASTSIASDGHGARAPAVRSRAFANIKPATTTSRSICWTASARRGKLVTRLYEPERSQSIWIVIDEGRLMRARVATLTKADHAVNAALALSQVALASGDRVGLLAYARPARQPPPSRCQGARWHMRQIIEQPRAPPRRGVGGRSSASRPAG